MKRHLFTIGIAVAFVVGGAAVGAAQSDPQGVGTPGPSGAQSAATASGAAQAQKKTKSNKKNSDKTNPSKPVAGNDTSKNGDPPPSLPGKLAGDINNTGKDTSDYVGCYFTRQQLLELRPKPEVATLSSADAEALRISVITEALDPQNASAFKPAGAATGSQASKPSAVAGDSDKEAAEKKDPARDFAEEIGNEPFEGLTRSQALSRTLSILRMYTDGKEEPLGPVAAKVAFEAAKRGANESPDFAKTQNYQQFTQELAAVPLDSETRSQVLSDISKDVDKNVGDTKVKSDINAAVEQALPPTTASPESQLAKSKVTDAARNSLANTGRPDDIFCSMSILSYETTRKAFGQTMADEYIGVQIVVRNVNPEKEFLVQSAEFKVDDDINGKLGRYFSGVDKLTAREYMLASQENGKRNLAVNSAAWLGAVLSATTPFTGPFIKDFSGVFNGGFTTGMLKVFPDHNTEQLKLLDDEGFSNSRTDRTVVPKAGTAEFVIFVSSNQFKEGWWTQDCANRIIIQSPKVDAKLEARCMGTFNQEAPDPKCVKVEIGIDIEAARRVCKYEHKDDADELPASGGEPSIVDFKPKTIAYRRWSPQALALFRELSLAVVAGTHVNEANDNKPALAKISCPVDENGNVKLDSAKNGVIACTLTGTNLDQVSQLKLRNSQDATDTTTAEGTVTTSGDSKSANVSFNVDNLGKLTASAYKVYTVTKDGVEGGGDQLVHFNGSSPVLSDLSPNTIDLTKPATIMLTGYHLDKLTGVCLAQSSSVSGGATLKVTAGTTAQAASLDISGENVKLGKLTLYPGDCNVTSPVPSVKALTLNVTTSLSFTPASAQVGKTLTITGNGLAQVTSVTFGGGVTATPTSATYTKLAVVVPAGAITGRLSITTTPTSDGVTIPSTDSFTVLPKAGGPAHSNGSPAKPK